MRSLLILLAFLLVAPVTAQEGYPLPADLPPITVDNAAQVTKLAQIGSKQQPGRLAWSANGSTLVVGTSDQIRLYATDALDQPPHIIEGTDGVNFVLEGDILNANGGRWNVETGESVSQTTASLRQFLSPDGTVRATFNIENDEVVVSLWDTTGSQLTTLPTGINQGVEAILINTDNRRVILMFEGLYAESDDYIMTSIAPQLQIWDAEQQSMLIAEDYIDQYVDRVELTADGGALLIVTRSNDEGLHVELWNPQSGEAIGKWDYVSLQPRLSPDKRMLAFSGNGDIQLWNGRELVPLHYEYGYDNAGLRDAVFSPDGKTLAVSTEYGGMILLWDISGASPSSEPKAILQNEYDVWEMAFSPDSSLLAVNARNDSIKVWDLGTNEVKAVVAGTNRIRFSPDGTLLQTYTLDRQMHLWDMPSGEVRYSFPRGVVIKQDWTQTAYWDGGRVNVVEIGTGEQVAIPVIESYLGTLNAFIPSVEQVIFARENTLRRFDLRTGMMLYALSEVGRVTALTEDGRWLIVDENLFGVHSGQPEPMSIWDSTAPDEPVVKLEIADGAYGFLFSPDGTLLARKLENIGPGPGSREQLWDARTMQLLATWTTGSYGVNPHAFSPDGTLLATGAGDSAVVLVDVAATLESASPTDVESYIVVRGALRFHHSYDHIQRIVFSADGQTIAVEVYSYVPEADLGRYSVWLWPLAEVIQQVDPIDVLEAVGVAFEDGRFVTFSRDGQLVVTQDSLAPMLRLWDVETGKHYAEIPDNRFAAFSPDGALLATYGEAGLALWEVAALVQGEVLPLVVLPDDTVNVSELAFNPDGTLLFVRGVSSVGVWGAVE